MSWPQVLGSFLTGSTAETGVLNDAAMAFAMRRAGRVAGRDGLAPPAPPEPDTLPALVSGAEHVRRCISENAQLVEEWCVAAHRAGWRVPDGQIPALIEFAAKHPKVRPHIVPVLGLRGLWVASLHPVFAQYFTVDPAGEPDEIRRQWTEGFLPERRYLLETVADMDLRRELVESTWKEDPARNRAAFIEILAKHPSEGDAAVFERALTDRSLEVRFFATLGIGHFPGHPAGEEVFLLAREFVTLGRSAKVSPPEMDDARFDRFGIASVKGPVKLDQKLARLTKLLHLIPPHRWEEEGDYPSSLVAGLGEDQRGRAVQDGLALAAMAFGDRGWAIVLLAAPAKAHHGPDYLLGLLPRADQERLALKIWDFDDPHKSFRFAQFAVTDQPWSAEFTRTFFRLVFENQNNLYADSLRDAPFFMDPNAIPFEWPPATQHWMEPFDRWQRILDLRRSMLHTIERSPKP